LSSPTVRPITAADEAAAVDTIVLAFAADPAARWTWPHSHNYLAAMPRFVRAFGGNAFASGGAYRTEDCRGVALWLPPGIHPDEARLGDLIDSTAAPTRRSDVAAVLEQMAGYHPSEPHWHLPVIGVDPPYQANALMAHALARCDRDRMPAYLESSNPRNISLYLRHGFELLGTIQAGSSPPIVPMLRRPR
jgi:ribosomal protein S18 acetylase RimI-like enzyme